MCTLASELGDMTSCTKSGLESNPKPRGTDIDTAGRASSVFDITAVARLYVCIYNIERMCHEIVSKDSQNRQCGTRHARTQE